jgi:GDSL-like Lipase/Acylhydrolase
MNFWVLISLFSSLVSAFAEGPTTVGSSSNSAGGTVLYQVAPIKATQVATGTTSGNRRIGTLFLAGDSFLDDVGNSNYLADKNPAPYQSSDGPSYGMALGNVLKQPLASIGRYVPSGQPPNALGHAYCVSGSQISQNSLVPDHGLNSQISQLLTDYRNTLPPASVVLINIGLNDIDIGVAVLGGQWSGQADSAWQVNGNQTIPAAGSTMKIAVKSSVGAVVGQPMSLPIRGTNVLAGVAITAVSPTTINFVVPPGWAGQVVGGGNITTLAQAYINNEMSVYLVPALRNIVSAGGTVIIASPLDASYLPANSGTANLTHNTWLMYVNQLDRAINASQKSILVFDQQELMADVIANPSKYGFKSVTTGWGGSASSSAKDYFFWDNYHPTAKGHLLIERKLLEMLNNSGYSL